MPLEAGAVARADMARPAENDSFLVGFLDPPLDDGTGFVGFFRRGAFGRARGRRPAVLDRTGGWNSMADGAVGDNFA